MTALRGIAAIGVVLFHAQGSWHPVFASGQRISMILVNGWVWVSFFFVLSGFVMMQAYRGMFARKLEARQLFRFVVARLGRIYPLHLLTLLLLAALWSAGVVRVVNPAGSFEASLALVHGFIYRSFVWNIPSWSISTEWIVYLIFPFIVPALMRVPRNLLWPLWLTTALCVWASFQRDGAAEQWPPGRLIVCFLEFLLGCVTHRIIEVGVWHRCRRPGVATIVALLPLLAMGTPAAHASDALLKFASIGFAFTIGIVAIEQTWCCGLLGSQTLLFFGTISYSIYLNHEILFSVMNAVADHRLNQRNALHHLPPGDAILLFAIYLLILFLLSYGTWRWIEEPFRRWSKRLVTGPRS